MLRISRRVVRLALFAGVLLTLFVSAGLLWLCNMQAQMLARPGRSHAQSTPESFGILNWREVHFQSEDNLQLSGWYVPPAETSAAVLFVNGHGGNREQYWQAAQIMAEGGYGLLLFDLRNCGTSEGSVTSMGYWEALDVQAAFAFLNNQPEIRQIVIYGVSMGGAAAVRAATQLPEARALIVESSYASLVHVVGDGVRARTGLPAFPFAEIIVWLTGRESNANLFDVNSEVAITQVRVPVLIMHGIQDDVIPVAHGERLYATANEPKELWLVPNAGHGGLTHVDPEGFAAHVLPFLERALG
jgi:pimeloyl-ACP methyl ester carboxylesterase